MRVIRRGVCVRCPLIQIVRQEDKSLLFKTLASRHNVWCLSLLVLLVCVLALSGCRPSPGARQQSLASWQELLTTAQEEAAKIDQNAVVHWIRAEFTRSHLILGEPVDADFIFLRPDGQRMRIVVRDSSPAHVVSIDEEFGIWNPAPSEDELQRYRMLVSTIALGPREIAQETLDEAGDSASGPLVAMFLDKDHQATVGSPNVWGVRYSNDDGSSLTLFMSPQTGQLLSRETSLVTLIPPQPDVSW